MKGKPCFEWWIEAIAKKVHTSPWDQNSKAMKNPMAYRKPLVESCRVCVFGKIEFVKVPKLNIAKPP